MRSPFSLPTLVFATGSLLAAGTVFAGTPDAAAEGARHARRAAMQQRMFERLDADRDGQVSRAEYKASVDARFDKLDANGDGSVDADEIARSPATAERVNRRAEGFIKRYAAEGSNKVTRADFCLDTARDCGEAARCPCEEACWKRGECAGDHASDLSCTAACITLAQQQPSAVYAENRCVLESECAAIPACAR